MEIICLLQAVYFVVFTVAYVLAPTFCNAFAAQLDERTLHCYLELLEGVQEGVLLPWGSSFVPEAICRMWGLEVGFLHNFPYLRPRPVLQRPFAARVAFRCVCCTSSPLLSGKGSRQFWW
jgi:hypothetical protein